MKTKDMEELNIQLYNFFKDIENNTIDTDQKKILTTTILKQITENINKLNLDTKEKIDNTFEE